MAKVVYSGAMTVSNDSEGHYASVDAYSPTDEPGVIRLCLLLDGLVECHSEGRTLTLRMPENCAADIAAALQKAAVRIEQLRALHRFGKLTERALYDPPIENLPISCEVDDGI